MRIATLCGIGLCCCLVVETYAQPADCATGQAAEVLDAGNVRAAIFNTGSLFWRKRFEPAVYEVPQGSGTNAIFTANLWIGGMVSDSLHLAGSIFGPYEFWPGPLDAHGDPPANCAAYDRIYNIRRTELEHYNRTGETTADLRNWPAALGAPVVDGDGVAGNYDLAAGDRPELLGDQTLWWVMKDAGGVHEETKGKALHIQVQATAFAYTHTQAIGNTTFYRYRLTYRGAAPLEQAYLGLFVDTSLGDFVDDWVGSDTTLMMGFVYNADNDDEGHYGMAPPALGASFLQGPPAYRGDELDNDGDGEIDEEGERLRMTAFFFPNGGLNDFPGDAQGYYYYMQARWKDGSPLRIGGRGRDFSEIPTTFMYPGDPVTCAFWSQCDPGYIREALDLADRRFLVSTGPFRMEPGQTEDVVIALVWSLGNSNLNSVRQLREDMRLVQNALPEILTPRPVEAPPLAPPVPLGFVENTPNPFGARTTIRYAVPQAQPVRLVVYDVLGRAVATLVEGEQQAGWHTAVLDGSSLPPGVYLYRLQIGPFYATRTMVRAR